MPLDVVDLKTFYAARLGTIARRLIVARMRQLWPSVSGDRILGIGYATPYLAELGGEADCCLAFMPAELGVMHWPAAAPNAAALVQDDALPLPGASVDRVLAIHSLEMADNAGDLLRELWRILAPGGRILVVVPNRRGLWARFERTPFGQGQPFSRGQLGTLLRETMFSPVAWTSALMMPPVANGFLVRGGTTGERIGSVLWPRFAGVLMVEATKLVRQPVRALRARERRTARALQPAWTPTAGVGAR